MFVIYCNLQSGSVLQVVEVTREVAVNHEVAHEVISIETGVQSDPTLHLGAHDLSA